MLRFDNQVAIVTGAARGVGRAHALLLASRGAAVVVNDIGYSSTFGGEPSPQPAETVVDEIIAGGGRAVASAHDVSSRTACEQMVKLAETQFGRVDILICNAGTNQPKPFEELSEADLDFLMRQHVNGTFNSVKAVWAPMKAQGGGRLVLTTSGASYFGLEQQVHYCAAKGAIHGMVRSLAMEGKSANIVVNGFWPSAFTRMVEVGDELKARMEATMPAHYPAQVAVWLAHSECPLNAEVLHGGSGRASRVFVAETRGYWDENLDVDEVAAHADDILSEEGYMVFATALESSEAQSRIVEEFKRGKS